MTISTITEHADGKFTITLQDRLILAAVADALVIVADDDAHDVDADRAAAVAIASDLVAIIADALAEPLRYRENCPNCPTGSGPPCEDCLPDYAQRCEDAPCCGCCD